MSKRGRKQLPPETIISKLREAKEALGPAFSQSRMRSLGLLSPQTAIRRFGSWDGALLAAGIQPEHAARVYTKEQVLDLVQEASRTLGGTPSWNAFRSLYSIDRDTVRRLFGTWLGALDAAGLNRFQLIPGEKSEKAKASRQAWKDRKKAARRAEMESVGLRLAGSPSEALAARLCAQALGTEEHTPIFLKEHSFDWLVSPRTGYRLRVDAYFPLFNLAVEYQSEIHFREGFLNESMEDVLYRDYVKRQLLADHGVTLVEFAYFEPLTLDYVKAKLSRRL